MLKNIGLLWEFCNHSPYLSECEIVLATDLSDPETVSAMKTLSAEGSCDVYFLSNRLGKGGTIKNVVPFLTGRVLVLLDADVPIDFRDLERIVKILLEGKERVILTQRFRRAIPPARLFLSIAYNSFARILFLTGIRDHQSGVKAFDKRVFLDATQYARSDGYAFDTEVIVWSRRLGYEIGIARINSVERRTKRSNVLPIRALLTMFIDLAILRLPFVLPPRRTLASIKIGTVFNRAGQVVGPEEMTVLNLKGGRTIGLLRKLYSVTAFRYNETP